MIEFQLSTSAVIGGAPYLIHRVEWVSGLVETAVDVQFSSSISTDDAAEIGKSDQYQYLGNCPPTPPLTQQQSIDNKSGLMLG